MSDKSNTIAVPFAVKNAFEEAAEYFPTPIQQFQLMDKYSRFDYSKGRRETWIEVVDRTISYLQELSENKLPQTEYDRIRKFVLEMKVAPSMRMLAMAGPAARRDNTVLYNCSAVGIDSIDTMVEELHIAMAGCGIGYSVEKHYIDKLPTVQKQQEGETLHYSIEDSTEGWANAFRLGLLSWFNGSDVTFDYSQIRKAGAPLRIKGGTASGPDPLRNLLGFTRKIILHRQDQKLHPLDVHDILCKLGETIVAGGVRRCLPGGTRVHTQRGAIPIQEVKVGDLAMTDQGYRRITDWFDQGKQDLVEIQTESGTTFQCTPNHRVAVLSDVFGGYIFKNADALQTDDRLLFVTNSITGEEQDLLPLSPKRVADRSGTVLQQPILTEETAWILGKFFADGYVQLTEHTDHGKKGNTQVSFACHTKETDQHNKILHWFDSIGVQGNIVKQSGNWIQIRTGNRQLARWFAQYKQPNVPLKIPECIWRNTEAVRAAFLRGVIDGDGCYTNRPFCVASTIYADFGRDLVKLLATFGIIAEFKSQRPAKRKWKELFVVSVKEESSLEKIRTTIASHSIHQRIRQSGYTIPRAFVKNDLTRKDYAQKWDGKKDMNSSSVADITNKRFFVPVKVVSVTPLEIPQSTYDITVEGQHVFVAEGYLVHNSALICLFDADDQEMRNCKNGDNIIGNEQRYMSNNSVVWKDVPSDAQIHEQMNEMDYGMRGEPGIFSRYNANHLSPDRRKVHGYEDYLTNPCGEVTLRPAQFCNLSQCIIRANDTAETLKEKVEVATIIGTIQSMATYFPYLSERWKTNTAKDRLLGVDLNGQADNTLTQLSNPHRAELFAGLKNHAIATNHKYATLLDINPSTSVTVVKPNGNSGILFNCASGLHTRWAKYYIRNARIQAQSPIARMLMDQGVPMNPENGQTWENASTYVIHFPMKSPEGALTRHDLTAIEQCENWLENKKYWTEMNPSVTITYQPEEFEALKAWVITHKEWVGGMSFLPAMDAHYEQMPNQEISQIEYEKIVQEFPTIDFSQLIKYESSDLTTASTELSCVSGACSIEEYKAQEQAIQYLQAAQQANLI